MGCLTYYDDVYDEQIACHTGSDYIYIQFNISGVIDYTREDFEDRFLSGVINQIPTRNPCILNWDGCTLKPNVWRGALPYRIDKIYIHENLNVQDEGESATSDCNLSLHSDIIQNVNIYGTYKYASLYAGIMFHNVHLDVKGCREVDVEGRHAISSTFRGDKLTAKFVATKGVNIETLSLVYTGRVYDPRCEINTAYDTTIISSDPIPDAPGEYIEGDWYQVNAGGALYSCTFVNCNVAGASLFNCNVNGILGSLGRVNNSDFDIKMRFNEYKYKQNYGYMHFHSLLNSNIKVNVILANLMVGNMRSSLVIVEPVYVDEIDKQLNPTILNSNIAITFADNPVYAVNGETINVTYNPYAGLPDNYSVTIANTNITETNKPTLNQEHGDTPRVIFEDIYSRYENFPVYVSNSSIMTMCICNPDDDYCDDK
jgi:hypothetical protein